MWACGQGSALKLKRTGEVWGRGRGHRKHTHTHIHTHTHTHRNTQEQQERTRRCCAYLLTYPLKSTLLLEHDQIARDNRLPAHSVTVSSYSDPCRNANVVALCLLTPCLNPPDVVFRAPVGYMQSPPSHHQQSLAISFPAACSRRLCC